MTRKDYIKAAELVRVEFNSESGDFWEAKAKERTVTIFCNLFKADNPRFNPDLFRQACNKK